VAENGDEMIAVINPTSNKVQYGLDGEYVIYAQGDQAGTTSLGTLAESITVAPMSVTIIAKNAN
jgi:hypothetical protein